MTTRRSEDIVLPQVSPGNTRTLNVIRYGEPGARPKAYLQTGLHADEIPGLLVMPYLDGLLRQIDADGGINGEVVLVPVANPIGLSQYVHGYLSGRYDLEQGQNFNRHYPDLGPAVASRVRDQLTSDPAANVSLIRSALGACAEEFGSTTELDVLRLHLLRLALDADICLDLHCDYEAILHVYTGTPLWPAASDLSAQMGAGVTLLAEISGGNPFDEAVGGVWWHLASQFPEVPVPPACLAATVELRGVRDVSRTLAQQDANNLSCLLMRRGVIAGDPGPLPDLMAPATPLAGVDEVKAPHAGVVVYAAQPGDRIRAGQTVAEVISLEPSQTATTVVARVDGILYARRGDRFARPGQTLCRIAGTEVLPDRVGANLLTD